jgi:hypothetical protein
LRFLRSPLIPIDEMAGQAGQVRQIQAFEDASDNHPVTVHVAVAGFPTSEAASSLSGGARSAHQPSAGTNNPYVLFKNSFISSNCILN